MNIESLKESIIKEVDAHCKELRELCMKIHAHPEMGFKEFQASGWLTDFLKKYGFEVEHGIGGLETSFRARYGKGKPEFALLAEYDALPELGHACGHNIISTSAVGAGVAAKLAADAFGGTVTVIGTPAEEL